MRTLVVYNHPYGRAILEAVEEGVKDGGWECRLINLDQDDFDLAM